MQSSLAPVAIFVYNRPWHTKQCLDSLSLNKLSDNSILFIYADGPKENATGEQLQKINEVRQLIRERKWCKEVHVIESNTNKGLANSVIDGVTEIVNKYGKIIVLEDDLVLSRGFLRYLNDALELYKNEEKVMQISGHSFPIEKLDVSHASFFIPITTSWGWGTWKRAWNKFDSNSTGYEILKTDLDVRTKFDINNSYPYASMLLMQMESKEINSWAIRWWWSVFKENGVSLFPDKSLVNNIGFDSEGTHTKTVNPFPLENFDENYEINKFPAEIKQNETFFKEVQKSLLKTTKQKKNIRGWFFTFVKKISNRINFFH